VLDFIYLSMWARNNNRVILRPRVESGEAERREMFPTHLCALPSCWATLASVLSWPRSLFSGEKKREE